MGNSGRTIGDWKPSILLLDLELVTYLGCVLFCVPVHGLFFVRRLGWFHALLLWGRGRHIIGCAVGKRMRWRTISLATTSLGETTGGGGRAGGRVCRLRVTGVTRRLRKGNG